MARKLVKLYLMIWFTQKNHTNGLCSLSSIFKVICFAAKRFFADCRKKTSLVIKMAKIYTIQQAQVSINTKLPANQQDCDKEYSPRQIGNDKIDVINQEFQLHSEKSINRFKLFTSIIENTQEEHPNLCYILYGCIGIGVTLVLNGVYTIIMYISLWFQFDKDMRINPSFRRRMVSFMISTSAYGMIVTELSIIKSLFILTSQSYQWIIAFVLPLIKEMNTRLVMIFSSRGAGGDIDCLRITCNQAIECEFSFFLALVIGSEATLSTSITIFAIDLIIHVFTCLKIIRAKKQGKKVELIKLLQDLVVNETVELMVPLAYVGCLVQGYYGPNYALIGNIGSNYWQYSAIEDIMHPVKYVMGFFIVDFCCVLVSGCVIWRYCQINIYRVYIELQREYGFYFALRLAGSVTAVS